MDSRYIIGLRSHVILGSVCAIFFGGCGIGAFLAEQYWPILIFAVFFLAGVYLVLSAGTYELTPHRITHRSFLGHFQLKWDEVAEAEWGAQGGIVLHGKNKRFIVAPLSAWSGRDKAKAVQLLAEKLERDGIKAYPSNWAEYKVHKNVRV